MFRNAAGGHVWVNGSDVARFGLMSKDRVIT